MEPVRGLDIALRTIAFIDFSMKVLDAHEENAAGSGEAKPKIDPLLEFLQFLTANWQDERRPEIKRERQIWALAMNCGVLGEEIIELVERERNKPKETPFHRIVAKAKKTFPKAIGPEKSSQLRTKLWESRLEISSVLKLLLLDFHSSTKSRLEMIRSMSQFMFEEELNQLNNMLAPIRGALEELSLGEGQSAKSKVHGSALLLNSASNTTTSDVSYEDLRNSLVQLQFLIDDFDWRTKILNRLGFQGISERERCIRDPIDGTLEWILDEDSSHSDVENADSDLGYDSENEENVQRNRFTFLSWLRNGREALVISGKTACGKSTLMKHLCNHPKVKAELERWAKPQTLVLASFFAWGPGNAFQNSAQGVFRSLVFQILRQCPDLLPEAIPRQVFDHQNLEVRECFSALERSLVCSKYKFCLFIDGLDELEGEDQFKLTQNLFKFSTRGNIKICLSLRPQSQILLPGSGAVIIHMDIFNKRDIAASTQQKFKESRAVIKFSERRESFWDLIEYVTSASNGLFLWANLVVDSFSQSTFRGYNFIEAVQRLRGIPQDLGDLYEQLLSTKVDWQEESRNAILLLVLMNPWDSLLNLMNLYWLDDLEKSHFPSYKNIQPLTVENIEEIQHGHELRLSRITNGLLEVSTVNSGEAVDLFFGKRIQFLHPTVRDYLLEPQNLRRLQSGASHIDSINVFVRLRLAEILFCPPNSNLSKDEFPVGSLLKSTLESFFFRSGVIAVDNMRQFHKGIVALQNSETYSRGKYLLQAAQYNLAVDTPLPAYFATENTASFSHLLAWYGIGFCDYLLAEIDHNPQLALATTDLSILLSASSGLNAALVPDLLDRRVSPHDSIVVYSLGDSAEPLNETCPIWTLMAGICVNGMISLRHGYLLRNSPSIFHQILARLVQYGADKDCLFVLEKCSISWDNMGSSEDITRPYIARLGDFLDEINGIEALDSLIYGNWRCNTIQEIVSVKSENIFPTSTTPFHIEMLKSAKFRVKWIRWGALDLHFSNICWRIW